MRIGLGLTVGRVRGRNKVTGGAAWTPATLGANLRAWYDASDSATITLDGSSNVQTWADKSGNSYTATQATAGIRPSVATAAQNGKDAILFDAGEGFSLPDLFTGLSAGTALIVAKNFNDPPDIGGGSKLDAGNFGGTSHHPFSDGVIYDGFGSNVRKTVGNPTPSLASWHIQEMLSAASDYRFYLSGSLLFSTATNTVAWTTTPAISTNFVGHIAEIIICSTALSDADRLLAETYLATKWSITLP